MKIKKQDFFIILYFFYIFDLVLLESQFADFSSLRSFISILRYIDLILILFYIISNKSVGKNGIGVLSTVLLISIINFLLFDGGTSIIGIILCVIASRNTSLKKIFLTTIISLVVGHFFVIFSSFTGLLEDRVSTRYIGEITGSFFSGLYARHSMGFLVHNQIPLTSMILYMYFIIYRKGNVTLIHHLVATIINYVLFMLFGSRVVFILCLILPSLVYCIHVWEQKHINVGIKSKNLKSAFTDVLISLAPLAICTISFVMTLSYHDGPFFTLLNTFFNNRLYFSYENIKHFGITLFGSGKTAGTAGLLLTVDNGYIILFLQFGIILGCLVIACWVYMGYIAIRRDNYYIALIILFLSVENIINAHLVNYKMIPLFCMIVHPNDSLILKESQVNSICSVSNINKFKNISMEQAKQIKRIHHSYQ